MVEDHRGERTPGIEGAVDHCLQRLGATVVADPGCGQALNGAGVVRRDGPVAQHAGQQQLRLGAPGGDLHLATFAKALAQAHHQARTGAQPRVQLPADEARLRAVRYLWLLFVRPGVDHSGARGCDRFDRDADVASPRHAGRALPHAAEAGLARRQRGIGRGDDHVWGQLGRHRALRKGWAQAWHVGWPGCGCCRCRGCCQRRCGLLRGGRRTQQRQQRRTEQQQVGGARPVWLGCAGQQGRGACGAGGRWWAHGAILYRLS